MSTTIDVAAGPVQSETAAGVTPLRVVTWNLNHWRQAVLPADTRAAAWAAIRERLGADVALLQEAVPPAGMDAASVVYGELAGHRAWGSAVAAMRPDLAVTTVRAVRMPWSRRHHLLGGTHPGAVAIAEVAVPGVEPIVMISVYGVMDGSATATMYRFIADLVPLFDSPRGARVILAGDFNVTRSTTDQRALDRARAVLGAVRSLGLVEAKGLPGVSLPPAAGESRACGCADPARCDHIPTWRTVELDHVFVSPSLAGQVTGLGAFPELATEGLSDHVPLVLDLALTAERTAHGWDEEALAVEVARRHGTQAGLVVERLVAWADDLERRLGEEDGVRVRGLTRFPMNGVTTEPELWVTLDFNLAPRGSQPLFSIRGDGHLVLQLGRMRHPPYDTAAARRDLLAQLGAIPGVHLRRARHDGWPRIPLAALENPEALGRFATVLEAVVRASRPLADGQEVGSAAAADA